jgi:NAD(P)-dependent dehydrogenase (short-subunit alcohol dehydrogenase family)
METNFFGMVRTVRRAVPAMTGPYKRVINVGSIGGRIGLPFQSMYSASKAAVMVWTDALRVETRSSGVLVSLVEPGDLKARSISHRSPYDRVGVVHVDP